MTETIKPPKLLTKAEKKKQKQLGKSKSDLRKRARITAQEMINGADASAALITAGYTKETAIHHTETILTNPTFQKTFKEILEKAGITDEFIAEKIRSLADAKETKFFAHKGEIRDQRDVEALDIQADMVKFAAKVKGHVVERSSVEVPGIEEILDQIALKRQQQIK